ncbi:kinase-like domain-containing protein [Mrakia frigida]|uniref:kinase-like domain-containing protein n=1 Tax=Mrakia frigida TaxID=29902 RepID=UPI003FCC21AF
MQSIQHSAPQPIPPPPQPSPSQASPILSHPSSSASATSVMTEDEEDLEDYRPGGYHPVRIGDVFRDGRYVIVRKLGWGHFSTVWLARDEKVKRHVALKVVKSDGHYTETALDEIQLLQRLVTSDPNHPGRRHVVQLLDDFRHTGPNGSHVCMVFEVLGENLLGLIKRYQHRGVPPHIVQQIAKQVLLGLDYLHKECQIIHTDLKPENVLICIEDVEAVVQAELASCPAAVPTKLVGVPPSQGRGGTQTPRREGIFIVGSQPLPSPSSSYGSSPMLDKFAFGMSSINDPPPSSSLGGSKLAGSSSKPGSSSSTSADPHFGEKTTIAPIVQRHGPSLLSQQAPLHSNNTTPNNSGFTLSLPGTSAISTATKNGNHASSSSSALNASGPNTPTPQTPDDARSTLPDFPVAPTAGDPTTLPPPFPYDPASLERITVKIADLGNACWVDHHFTNDIQTRQYRCPEIILGTSWGPSVDNWSAACLTFELITGDYLFDPQPGTKYDKDDDHMAQIVELLGEIPKSLALSGRYSQELFNKKGELRHIHKLRYWPVTSVLKEKYGMTVEEADLFSSFLSPMLNLYGDKRAQARDMIDHPWLGGVVVQGEIEVAEQRANSASTSAASSVVGSASASAALPPPRPIGAAVPVPKVAGTQKKTGFDVLKGKAKATLGGSK